MSRLADKYGGDQAATDVSQVMRLPGFRNKKADRGDAMVSWTDHGGGPVKAEAFRNLPEIRKIPTRGRERKRSPRGANSQSERDWAYVREVLRNGAKPDALIDELSWLSSGKISLIPATTRLEPLHGPATPSSCSPLSKPRRRSVSPVQSPDLVPPASSRGRLKKGAFDETLSRGPVSGPKPPPKPSYSAASQNCVSYRHL